MRSTYHTQQTGRRRRGQRAELGRTEKKRLVQLVISVALFLLVFVGKGILPNQMSQIMNGIRNALQANINFAEAFTQAGDALQQGAPVFDTLSDFCITVFGPTSIPQEEETPEVAEGTLIYPEVRQQLSSGERIPVTTLENFPASGQTKMPAEKQPDTAPKEDVQTAAHEEEEQGQQETVIPVGMVVKDIPYTGDELPQHASMEWLSLGDLETQNPIEGVLTSAFSYRDHPIDGNYGFHYGADLAAAWGTDIGAFADGTVEFTGESDSYGLYLQLDHGNGIKSFYAHCSKICVKQGQTVKMGEKIAEVGDTGNATGPHLHLQIKLNDTWLNPLYYVTAQT